MANRVSNVYLTSAAERGCLLWNLTLGRRWNVKVLLSGDDSNFSAKSGTGSNLSFLRVSPLKISCRILSAAVSVLRRGSKVSMRFSSMTVISPGAPPLRQPDSVGMRTIEEINNRVRLKGAGGRRISTLVMVYLFVCFLSSL